MKAEELRLGNWVDSETYGEFKIIGLSIFGENKATFFKSMEYYPKATTIKTTKPIKLTEEWLIKFGFMPKGGYYNKEAYNIEIINEFEFIYFSIIDSDYDFEIKYVHQLQNLYFALTGNELINKK